MAMTPQAGKILAPSQPEAGVHSPPHAMDQCDFQLIRFTCREDTVSS